MRTSFITIWLQGPDWNPDVLLSDAGAELGRPGQCGVAERTAEPFCGLVWPSVCFVSSKCVHTVQSKSYDPLSKLLQQKTGH